MKRGLIILSIIILLSLSIISASDIAYVLKNPEKPDKVFMNIFNETGLSVDLINSENIRGFDFSGYDFIFVGDDRIKNSEYIPEFPIVIANGYYGKDLRISKKNSIKKIAANSPLEIIKDRNLVQVYDTSKFKFRRVNLAYYYIPEKYKKNLISVATVNLGSDSETGDVISYSSNGVKKCFFGITETEYWTNDAKELFRNCVNFVWSGGGQDGEDDESNETQIHNIGIDESYSNSVNGIRIRDLENETYLLENISELTCNKKYTISYKTVNYGNFSENITFTGMIANYSWTTLKDSLEPGDYTTAGSKTINVSFFPGIYNLNISADILEDSNLLDNFMSRNVKVVC